MSAVLFNEDARKAVVTANNLAISKASETVGLDDLRIAIELVGRGEGTLHADGHCLLSADVKRALASLIALVPDGERVALGHLRSVAESGMEG